MMVVIDWYDYTKLVANLLSTIGSTTMVLTTFMSLADKSKITSRILLFLAISDFFYSITSAITRIIKVSNEHYLATIWNNYFYIIFVAAIHYAFEFASFLWTATLACYIVKENRKQFQLYLAHYCIWTLVLLYFIAEVFTLRYYDPDSSPCDLKYNMVRIVWDVSAIFALFAVIFALFIFAKRRKSQVKETSGSAVLSRLRMYLVAYALLVTSNIVRDIIEVSCSAPVNSVPYNNFIGIATSLFALLPLANFIIYAANHRWLCSRHHQRHDTNKSDRSDERSIFSYPGDIQELSGLTIEERIGEGIAAVFKGKWRGAEVAVKMQLLSINIMDDYKNFQDACNEEIQQEAQMMKSLRHPNIVLFMEAGFFNGSICIISEYCARGSLRDVLESTDSNQLVWAMKIRLAIGIAYGIQYLHSATPPMIHRDLKSPNILVDETWHAKVADFGTLRFAEIVYNRDHKLHDQEAGLMTTCVGTTRWMAPEIIRGDAYDEKIDIFSFGLILWEMIEGKLPYHDTQWNHTIEDMILQGKRPEIPAYRCPPRWKVLISMCWQSNPKDRPSIQQVLGSLHRVSKEEIWESLYDKKNRYTRLDKNLQSIDCDYILQNTACQGDEEEFAWSSHNYNSPTTVNYSKYQV